MKRRIMSLILAIAMIVTMIPQAAFAEDEMRFGFRSVEIAEDGYTIEEEGALSGGWDASPGITCNSSFRYVENGSEKVVRAEEMYSTNEDVVEISQHEQYPEVTVMTVKSYGKAYVCYEVDGVTYKVNISIDLPSYGFSTTPEMTGDSVIDSFKVSDENNVIYFAMTENRLIESIQLDRVFNEIAEIEIDDSKRFATITFKEMIREQGPYGLFGTFTYENDNEEYEFGSSLWLSNGNPKLVYRDVAWNDAGPYEDPDYTIGSVAYTSPDSMFEVYIYLEENGQLTLLQPSDLYSSDESFVVLHESEYSNIVRYEVLKYGEGEICYERDGKVYSLNVVADIPEHGFSNSPEYNIDTYISEFKVTDSANTIYYAAKEGCLIESFALSEEFDAIADSSIKENGKYVEIQIHGVPYNNEDYQITGTVQYTEEDFNNILNSIRLKNDESGLMYRYADWSEEGYWGNPEWDLYNRWKGIPGESGIICFYYVENGMETPVGYEDLRVEDESIAKIHSDGYIQGTVAIEALHEGNTTVNYVKDDVTYSVDINVVLPRVGFYSEPEISGDNYLQRFVVTKDNNTIYLVAKDGWKFTEIESMYGQPADYATATISDDQTYITIQFSEDVIENDFYIDCRICNSDGEEEWSPHSIFIENGKPALVYKNVWYNGDEYYEDEEYYNKTLEMGYKQGTVVHFYYKAGDEVTLLAPSDVRSADESIVTVSGISENGNEIEVKTVGVGETAILYTIDDVTYSLPVTVPLPLVGIYNAPEASADKLISEFTLTEDSKEVYVVVKDGWKLTDVSLRDGFEYYGEVQMSDDRTYAKITLSDRIKDSDYYLEAYMYNEEYDEYTSDWLYFDVKNHLPGLKYGYVYEEDGGLIEGEELYDGWHEYPNYEEPVIFYYCENGVRTKVKSSELTIKDEGIITLTPINEDEYAVDVAFVGCGETTINYTINGKTYAVNVKVELPEVGYYSSPIASAETYIDDFLCYGEDNTFFLVPSEGWTLADVRLPEYLKDFAELTVDPLAKAFAAIEITDDNFDDTHFYLMCDYFNSETGEIRDGWEYGIFVENGNPDLKFHYGYFEDDRPVESEWMYYETSFWGCKGDENFLYLYCVENREGTRVTYDQVTSSDENVVKVKPLAKDPNATMLEFVGFGKATIDYEVDGKTYSMNVFSELPESGFASEPTFNEETFISDFTVTDTNDTFYLVINQEGAWLDNLQLRDGLEGIAEARVLEDYKNVVEIKVTGTPRDGEWGNVSVMVNYEEDEWTYTYVFDRGLRLYNGKTALKFHWGEWDEAGNLFERDDEEMQGFWQTAPGNSSVMYFYTVKDGNADRAIFEQLTSTNEDVVIIREENRDSRAVRLEVVGFGNAEIQCTIDGVTYSMPVESTLPDVGFYSSPEASKNTYINEFEYTEDNNKFYLVSNGEFIISNPVISGELADLATVELDESGLFATITLNGTPQDNRWIQLQYGVTNVNHPGDTWMNGRGIRVKNNMPSLKFNWGEWNNDNLFENTDDEMQGFWSGVPGDSPTMYFYTVKDGETQRAIFKQLTSTNEDVVVIREENRDSRAVRLDIVGFGKAEIQCTIDGVTYSMPVESTLPEAGFYSAPEASEETFLKEFGYTEDNNKFYLVSNGEFIISNPVIGGDFFDLATVELDESGLFATITITGTPKEGNWFHIEYEITNINHPDDTRVNGRGIEVVNNMPALKCRWADWDENDKMYENTENSLSGSWEAAPGDSSPVYFYVVKDGKETRVTYNMLESTDENVVIITREREDSRAARLEMVGFGQAEIRCTVDGEIYSMPVTSCLPQTGFYTTSTASEETYIREFDLTEDNNKFYLVSNGDVRISLPMNASGLYEIAQVTLDSSGMFAEIEITGSPEDGRWYNMEVGVTNVNDPEDSWMNGRSILINNHLPGLKYRWADYDDGYMKENTEYPLESTWYTNPGVRSDLYVYYVKDGVETRLQASKLTSSDERVVVIREADDPNGVVLETVGFGEARIDYFVDGKMYSIPVVSELPGFGFYSANEVSEETYITEYMITENTSVIYLLAKDDYVMSDVVLDEEFAAFAEAEIYKDGTGAKITITGEPLWDGGYGVHFFGSHVDFPEDSWEGGAQIQLIDRKPGLRWIWSDVDVEEGNVPFEKELWAAPGEAHEVFMYYINGVEEVKLSIDDVKSTNEDVVKVVEAENGAVIIEFVGFGEAQIVYTDANGKEYGIKLYSELSAFGFYDECEATEENWLAGKVEITDDDNVFYFMGIYDLLVEKVELSDEVAEYATVEVDKAGKFAKITIDKEFEADFFEMYVEISDGEEYGDSTTVGIELINVKSSLEFCWPDETGAASEEFFNTLYTAYGYDEYAYIYHVVGDSATMLSIEDLKVSDDSIIKLEEAENGMIKVSALGWGEVEISYTVNGKTYSCVVDSYVPEVGYFDEPVKDKENWIPNTITITDDDNVFYFMTTEGIVIDRIEFNSDVEDFATMKVSEDRTLATITIDGDFDGAYFELSYDLSHPDGWSRSSTHGTFLVDGRTPEQPDEPFVPVVPDGVDYAPYYDAATGTIHGIKVGDEVEVGTVFSGNNLEEGQMLAFGYKAYDTDVIFGYRMLFDRGLYTVGEEEGNFDPADGWVVGSVHYNEMEDMLVISMVSKVPPVQINPINISVDWSKLKEFKVGEQVPEQVEAVSITGEGVARVWPADVLFAVREEHVDKGYITEEQYMSAIRNNSGWWFVSWIDDEFIASAGDEFTVRVDATSEIGYVFAYSQEEQITGNIVLYTSDIVVLSAGSYVGDYAGMAATFDIKLGSIEKISEKANPVVKLTGWQLIDGKWYFYDNEGQRVTNQWRKDSKGWCFLGEDGAMLTSQWVKDSKGYCFVDESGYMVYNQWCEDANGLAYAGSDGYRQTSKWIQDSKGWSYVDETGYKVYNEWVSDCYIDDTGYMAANKWIETDDGFLYMGANGYKTTNKWVQRAGKWCYLGANGYAVTNQWMKDSTGWCYLDDRGFMVYDQWIADSKGLCYVGSNGYMATNQWVETAEGKVYVGGSGYKVTNGWVKDSNGMCYLGEDGLQVYDQWVTDDNGTCYIGSNGYVSKDMWIQTDDGWCYVGSDGYRVANQWLKKVGNWAYVGADGYLVTNDWAKDGSRWCYMDDKGFMTKDQWINDGTGSCYMDANGYLVTNKWLMVDGEWVYVGNSGYMVVNAWAKDSKGWCYLDENGHMVYNDWVADSKGEVYLDASGYMVTNKWIAIGDEWCYVGSDGYKVTNQWRKDSAGWCYLGEDGFMLRNQWVKDSVGYCYVDGSGYMVYSQWVDIEEDRYYVNSSGYRATGWLQLEGKWYYFKEDGVMARDEMIGNDYVDENGVWVK